MSKWYEVAITAHKVIAVEMEDISTIEDAHNFALSECNLDYHDITDSSIIPLITTEQIDCARRHADQVEAL